MSGFFTLQALIMFVLGVVLAANVKSWFGAAKSRVGG